MNEGDAPVRGLDVALFYPDIRHIVTTRVRPSQYGLDPEEVISQVCAQILHKNRTSERPFDPTRSKATTYIFFVGQSTAKNMYHRKEQRVFEHRVRNPLVENRLVEGIEYQTERAVWVEPQRQDETSRDAVRKPLERDAEERRVGLREDYRRLALEASGAGAERRSEIQKAQARILDEIGHLSRYDTTVRPVQPAGKKKQGVFVLLAPAHAEGDSLFEMLSRFLPWLERQKDGAYVRELELARLLYQGYTLPEAAEILVISPEEMKRAQTSLLDLGRHWRRHQRFNITTQLPLPDPVEEENVIDALRSSPEEVLLNVDEDVKVPSDIEIPPELLKDACALLLALQGPEAWGCKTWGAAHRRVAHLSGSPVSSIGFAERMFSAWLTQDGRAQRAWANVGVEDRRGKKAIVWQWRNRPNDLEAAIRARVGR